MPKLIKLCSQCGHEKEFTPSGNICKDCKKIVNRNYIPKGAIISREPEWQSWAQMLRRCKDKNAATWKYYGAKGIAVCERWLVYENFKKDMPKRPGKEYSLDRIDNLKGYFPGNCRWVTSDIQNRNKSNNVMVRYMGKEILLCDLALKVKVNQKLLRMRIFVYGWPIDRAVQNKNFKIKQVNV